MDSKSVTKLANALSKSNLSTFGLDCCNGMTAGFMTQIVDAVGVIGIRNLFLNEYDMDDNVGVALGKSLCKMNTLKTLSLNGMRDYETHPPTFIGSITPAGMDAIVSSLASGSLEKLYLGDNDIGSGGGVVLASGLTHNSSLRILQLGRSNIGVEGGIALAEALEGNTTLEKFDISYAMSRAQGDTVLSADGWIYFFDFLKNCAFHQLTLQGNTIEDENIQPMVDSLNTMMSLTKLDLFGVFITPSGWNTVFDLLHRPGSILDRLVELEIGLEGGGVNDEVLIKVASVLANNSSLKKLSFVGRDLTDVGWSAIENLLCNKSSIETIYDSNHTLADGMIVGAAPPRVGLLFKLNKGNDKEDVARQKIIQYHFLEGNGCNLHEIMKMDVELIPHVIGCFGKYDILSLEVGFFEPPKFIVIGLELIYRLTRGMPSSLFDAESKGKKRKTLKGKRAREEMGGGE